MKKSFLIIIIIYFICKYIRGIKLFIYKDLKLVFFIHLFITLTK